VRVDEETVMTAKQIRELQKKNAILEEETKCGSSFKKSTSNRYFMQGFKSKSEYL